MQPNNEQCITIEELQSQVKRMQDAIYNIQMEMQLEANNFQNVYATGSQMVGYPMLPPSYMEARSLTSVAPKMKMSFSDKTEIDE